MKDKSEKELRKIAGNMSRSDSAKASAELMRRSKTGGLSKPYKPAYLKNNTILSFKQYIMETYK